MIFEMIEDHRWLIGQIIGWIGMVLVIIRFQQKTSLQIRKWNMATTSAFALHYAFLASWSGCIIMIIAGFRSGLLVNQKFWVHKKKIGVSAVTIGLFFTGFSFETWVDALPFLGLFFGTLTDLQSRAMTARFFAVIYQSMWLVFNIMEGSQGGMANSAINITTNIVGFWRHQLYPYLKTGNKDYFKI